MLIRLLVAGAVALGAAAHAEPHKAHQKPVRVKTSCIGDRCAIYANGYRVGTSKRESTGRITIRDKRGRLIARIDTE